MNMVQRQTLLNLVEELEDALQETDWHGECKGGTGSDVRSAFDTLSEHVNRYLPHGGAG